ncbi:hypothetical protein M413DRAFT_438920 [Hebeloma cylindrosporum]|uniref:Uncharacterized protein n=1 Tax=Hebeloma cylindrosporum TaxID=76867 RepID=A0A0C2YJ35_HEBCY|nr:hypothetical protein M413DRAFT_438920 [Hebeloma cylindrosporum h7]
MSYYQHYQAPINGDYISPYSLTNVTNAPTTSHSMPMPHVKVNRGVRLQDVGSLEPGTQHQLSQDPVPTPQSILDGSYSAALAFSEANRDVVTYIPRAPEYCGKPTLPSIIFTVNGRPGPYLKDVIKGRVMLDGAYDTVFREFSWKQTSLTIDWPGVTTSAEHITCGDKTHHSTRTEVAQLVAARVAHLLMTGYNGKPLKWGPQVIDANTRPWNLKKIDYRDVRLVAINYYRKTWVPVLAVDA